MLSYILTLHYMYSSLATVSLEDVIKEHKAEVLTGDVCRITIRHDHVFEDALVPSCNNDWDKKLIRVTFLEEPAIDYDGPTREFFLYC